MARGRRDERENSAGAPAPHAARHPQAVRDHCPVDCVVVLATGGHSAADRPAGLFTVAGLTVLERAVRTIREAGFAQPVVVTGGPHAGAVSDLVARRNLPAEVVTVDGWADADRAAATGRAADRRYLVVPGDQVFEAATVRHLADSRDRTVLAGDTGLTVADRDTVVVVLAAGERGRDVATAVTAAADPPRRDPVGFTATVAEPAHVRPAERRLWRRFGPKPTDGLVARYLNRPLSAPVTLLLVRRPRVTPGVLTLLSFLLVVAGAGCLAVGGRWWLVAGGLLIAAGNAMDGVDGETARLTMRTTRRGALLDTILDRYADLAVIAGLALASGGGAGAWAWAFLAAVAALLVPYINVLSPDAPQRLLRRDVRLLLCAVAAAVGLPLWGLVVVAVVGNLDAARVLFAVIRRASA